MNKINNAGIIGAVVSTFALLAGCSGSTGSGADSGSAQPAAAAGQKASNGSTGRVYTKGIEARAGKESFTANIISPPADADKQFEPVPAPVVNGVTAREPDATVISRFQRYVMNDDLAITTGKLNHTREEAIISADFRLGQSLSLIPVERSTGQFSFERTTESADAAIDTGKNIILAVNADPFDIVNGWNLGVIKMNGVTYTGYADRTEELIVVYDDGHADILDTPPQFTLRSYVNNVSAGDVAAVGYFDFGTQKNKEFRRGGTTGVSVYPGDNYRGFIDMSNRRGVLVKPRANGVTVVKRDERRNSVQFAPLGGPVVAMVEGDPAYVVPSGHALVVGADQANVGDNIDLRYETDDPTWQHVKSAMGAGFGVGLLVENGEPGPGAANERDISSRIAFGIRADGSYFFVAVDKPVGSTADGITLRKLAQIMIAYGAVKAVNMDGGGSTTIVSRSPGEAYTHLLNVPSDGAERAVAGKLALALDERRARYPDAVAVYPRELTVLAGSVFRRFKGVGFNSDTWDAAGTPAEYGISTKSIGLIDRRSGAFQAGSANAEGYVVVRVGRNKGVAKVRVVTTVDEMRFERDSYAVDGGSTITLRPALISNGESITYDSAVLSYALDNTADCRIDAASGVLTAANVQGKRCVVTVTGAGKSASVAVDIGVPPVVIENFEGNNAIYAAGGARFSTVRIDPVTTPAFDGQYSMKLTWQANPAQPGTFGAYLTDPTRAKTLPGYPKYLGVNVYIPDELAGKVWWVRGLLIDADGKSVTINYNNDGDSLPERGWSFMKAEIPSGFRAPFRFSQPFRFLVLKTAERIDSSVVLDNFTAVYSDKTDLQGPGVTATPAANGEVNTISPAVVLQVNDASGVDFNRLFLSLDGEDVSGLATNNGADRIEYQTSELSEGWHRIEYRIADINGNVTAGDQLFAVRAGGARIYVDSDAVQFYPGGTFELPIRVTGAEQFESFRLNLSYDSTKTTMTVVNADLAATNVVQQPGVWQGDFAGFNAGTGVLATLRLQVKNYIQNTFISVGVNGTLDGRVYYHPVIRKPVGSKYVLMTSWGLQGADSQFLVADNTGKPAAGVNVEMVTYDAANDTVRAVVPLGQTDGEGMLTVRLNASGNSEELIFRAYDATGSSLMTKVESLIERLGATPRYVFLTPAEQPTSVNVTWFTATTVTSSEVRYGRVGRPASGVASGRSEIVPFFYGAEAGAVRVHHAVMSQLRPGETYQYTVGDGAAAVSPAYTFRTDNCDDNVNIHLFGDTQTLSDENIYNGSALVTQLHRKMQAQLPQEDLILHVGDITDDLTDYRLTRLFFGALEGEGRLASRLFVPTQGNHEALNEGAEKFASIFVNPSNSSVTTSPYNKAVYSFDYGNAHIGVISTEVTEADWPVMMDWLKRDMSRSRKTWKIVMLHRPPYAGNPASGNERSNKYLPPVVDAAGIDLVIAGHDHMYARTVPLRAGRRSINGATYLIAGSDSAKFYDNNGAGIASIADVLFDDNQQTFTTLAIRGNRMQILTRALDGTVVDDTTIRAKRLYH